MTSEYSKEDGAISDISDHSPECDSVVEVWKKLGSKEDLFQEDGRLNMVVKDVQQFPSITSPKSLGVDLGTQVEVSNQLKIHSVIKLSHNEIETPTSGRLLGDHLDGTNQVTWPSKESNSECPHHGQVEDASISADMRKKEHTDTKRNTFLQNVSNVTTVVAGILRVNFKALQLMPEKTIISLESMGYDDDLSSPLFIVHPMEGTCKVLEGVARYIQCPVFGLQFTNLAPRSTITDLAAFYLQHIQSIQVKGPYYIGGYSFGVLIATEMASQLEEVGEMVHLLALDGLASYYNIPSIGEDMIMASINIFDQEIITQLISQYLPSTDISKLKNTLSSLSSWPEYFEHCISLLATQDVVASQITDLKEVCECFRWRYRALLYHLLPENKSIKGEVVVISARDSFMRLLQGEHLGFKSICNKEVKIFTVEGNHISFLSYVKHVKEVAEIINEHFVCRC